VATPQKTATTQKPGINASAIAAIVDELGALERKLQPFKPEMARVEDLRKALRAMFDTSPPAEAFQPSGDAFFATVGPRAVERSINPAKLIKAIGLKMYASFATVTLKALEANVACGIVAGVVSSANTGARPIKTFERIR
jgi:hypothetical protein